MKFSVTSRISRTTGATITNISLTPIVSPLLSQIMINEEPDKGGEA